MLGRKKFVRRFCSKCNLCLNIDVLQKPSFCYDFIYVKKPSKFINNVFPKIKKTDIESLTEGRDDLEAIKDIFCSAKACAVINNGKPCSPEQLDLCSDMFVGQYLQMDPEPKEVSVPEGQLSFEEFAMGKGSRKKRKKQKKNKSKNHRNQKSKKKVQKKSSFIFGGGEQWQILIQSITEGYDEDKDKQQGNASQS